jgi:hypothetical protein
MVDFEVPRGVRLLREASTARSQLAHTAARRSTHQPFRTTSKGDAMFGRNMGRVIGPLVALLLIGIVAAVAFTAGQASVPVGGVAGGAGAAVPVYVGHYGWGFGFGFLGFLFPLFFILLLFWLLRPRWGGHRGYGYGPGPWGRGRWGDSGPEGTDDPNSPWAARRRALEELHRQLHEADRGGGGAGGAGGPGSSGAGSGSGSDRGPTTPTTL